MLYEVITIYHLVKEKGMTLKGAEKKLKENKEDTINRITSYNVCYT